MAALSKTVDSGSGASGDYASLNALESAEQQDLTDGGGDTFAAICTTTGDNAADTTATLLNGFTTGIANYVTVVAASGDEALITGYDTSRYRIEVSNDECLHLVDDYYRFINLQIKTTTTGTTSYGIRVNGGASGDIYVDSCRIEGVGGGSAILLGVYTDGPGRLYVYNTIVNNIGTFGASNVGIQIAAGAGELYNNTLYNINRAIYFASGAADNDTTAKNNLVFNNTDDFLDANTGSVYDYNASDDADGTNAQTVNSTDDWAAEVVDAAGGDFTLVLGSVCDDNGTDDPGSGLFSDDIAGTTRVSPWDIGAFELIAGGVTHDVSAADAIKLSDTSAVSLIIQGLSSDGIQLSDISAGALTIAVIAADGLDLSDAPVAEGILSLSAADGIDLSDAAVIESILALSVIDGIELSDTSTAEAILSLSAADGIKLSDTSTAGGLISVSVADGIKLSDVALAERILSLLVADGIKISDSSAGVFNFSVTVADGLVLSDAITTILNLLVSISDGIELSDISTDVSVAVSGKMIVTISSKSARIRYEGKMPNVDLASKKPRIKFEGV